MTDEHLKNLKTAMEVVERLEKAKRECETRIAESSKTLPVFAQAQLAAEYASTVTALAFAQQRRQQLIAGPGPAGTLAARLKESADRLWDGAESLEHAANGEKAEARARLRADAAQANRPENAAINATLAENIRLFRGIRGSISARQRNIGRECHGRRGCQRFPRSQTRSALRAVDSPWLRPWQEGLYGSKALALLPVQQAGV